MIGHWKISGSWRPTCERNVEPVLGAWLKQALPSPARPEEGMQTHRFVYNEAG